MVLVDGDRWRLGLPKKTQVVAAGTQSQLKKPFLICSCYVRLMGARELDECPPVPPHHNQLLPMNPRKLKDQFPTHHQAKE
jgi:hypothetical protein